MFQALAAPCIEIVHHEVTALADDVWRIEVGLANTGWLPTYVSDMAKKEHLVRPLVAELSGDVDVIGGLGRRELGQLEGRSAARFAGMVDGTPDRTLVAWTVRGAAGTQVAVTVVHQRAGQAATTVTLA